MKFIDGEIKTFTYRDEVHKYFQVSVEYEGMKLQYDCHSDGTWECRILENLDTPEPLKEWFEVIECQS